MLNIKADPAIKFRNVNVGRSENNVSRYSLRFAFQFLTWCTTGVNASIFPSTFPQFLIRSSVLHDFHLARCSFSCSYCPFTFSAFLTRFLPAWLRLRVRVRQALAVLPDVVPTLCSSFFHPRTAHLLPCRSVCPCDFLSVFLTSATFVFFSALSSSTLRLLRLFRRSYYILFPPRFL